MSTVIAVDVPPTVARGDDRALRRLGYTVVAIVFGGFGGFAALAPLGSAAVAPGVVAVQNSRKTIQHLEGGIVRTLQVTEGQQVQRGQLLLELEGRQYRAELDAVSVQHATLEAVQARLLAERDGLDAIQFPAAAALPLDDPRVAGARSGQLGLFESRRKAYLGEISVLDQAVSQLRAQIAGLNSVRHSKRELVASYRSEITDLRELLAEGFADRQKLRDYERNVAVLGGEISELDSSTAAAAAKISETQLRALQVRRDFQAQVATELGDTQVKLSDASERLKAAGDRVERTQIRAPVSGRVLNLRVHTLGGVVTPGEPLMDLVPDRAELIVEAHVSPLDIDRVHGGLDATVHLTGLRFDQPRRLNARVLTVSADRLVDERSGNAWYSAQVLIDAASLKRIGEVPLQPGMPAEVMINTGSRTLLGYLWEPIGSAIRRSFTED